MPEEPKDRLAEVVKTLTGKGHAEIGRLWGVSGPMVGMMLSGKRDVSVGVARVIERVSGFRAAWLVFGDLPMRVGEPLAVALEQARLAGRREVAIEVAAEAQKVLSEVTGRGAGSFEVSGSGTGTVGGESGAAGKPPSGPSPETVAEAVRGTQSRGGAGKGKDAGKGRGQRGSQSA